VLQCVAVCCSVLQCVAVCCRVLQCVAVCCSVLQCVAVCCRVLRNIELQCVAVCCRERKTRQRRVFLEALSAHLLPLLQHTATHFCVAVCCSALQRNEGAAAASVARGTLCASPSSTATHLFCCSVPQWVSKKKRRGECFSSKKASNPATQTRFQSTCNPPWIFTKKKLWNSSKEPSISANNPQVSRRENVSAKER